MEPGNQVEIRKVCLPPDMAELESQVYHLLAKKIEKYES